MKYFRSILCFALCIIVLAACKERPPRHVLDEATLENLLYDYHVAQSMAAVTAHRDSLSFQRRLYEHAVFEKYGIRETDFDSTMMWYARHSERLHGVYTRVNERLAEAAAALGGGGVSSLPGGLAAGDTANVWQGTEFVVLSPATTNRFQFVQKADTSFYANDRLTWSFRTQWIYKEGVKTASAVMYVRYENDSVATVTRSLYSTGLQELTLSLGPEKVREICGFVYQNASWSERARLLVLSDFSLVKTHTKPRQPVADSVSAPVSRDSLHAVAADTADGRRVHADTSVSVNALRPEQSGHHKPMRSHRPGQPRP